MSSLFDELAMPDSRQRISKLRTQDHILKEQIGAMWQEIEAVL